MARNSSQISSLQELDPRALSHLHEEHYAKIYRYALQRLSDRQLAEDASSEVFVRLVEALHSGKGPNKNVTGWLFQTASNIINDFYRKEYRHATDPLDPHQISEQSKAEAQTTTNSYDPMLSQALRQLTEDQQQVLALRFNADLSLAETAKILNRSVNAIKALQFRAISSLRDALKEKNR